jgi:hypothetical protein
MMKKFYKKNAGWLIKDLRAKNNQFIFTNSTAALKFAKIFIKLNRQNWCSPYNSTLSHILADIIRLGLAKKIISKKDMFSDDQIVTKKLKSANNSKISKNFKLLKNLKIKLVSPNQADWHLKAKGRIIDPLILKNDQLIRLSKINKDYSKKISNFKKYAQKGFYIKIIS